MYEYIHAHRGVLAVWSAKAGAARVLAVEYTDMAKHARTIVARNGVENIVEVGLFCIFGLACTP